MRVHLIDGTYELFRQHYGAARGESTPSRYAATTGVLASTLALIAEGATHVGVASDHVIESFRNDLWPGYKTSAGMDPALLEQIPLVEEALAAMGVVTWTMVEHEADDALASAAAVARADARVSEVLIVTPDKDLAQCVEGTRVVQLDRRKRVVMDEAAVLEKFGVPPHAIPDWLALVGDTSDGYPGIAGFGTRSAAAVLVRYGSLEGIPASGAEWRVEGLRGAERLAATLSSQRELALLFRRLATLVSDVPVGAVDDWRWAGPSAEFEKLAKRLGAPQLAEQAKRLAG